MIGDQYDPMALLHSCHTICEFQRDESDDNDDSENEDEGRYRYVGG
jgi:hypothetical protein